MTNKEIVASFYNKALTVNQETRPTQVFNSILADGFLSQGSVESKNKEQLSGQVEFFWKLIPNLKWKPQEIIGAGDQVIVRSIASGNPSGEFMGLKTDGTKSFQIMTIDIHTVKDGKIVNVHHLEDWGTAINQLKS